eukprot:scaffold15105_cov99-Amphora_coffeaeformis.AAC.1
MFGDRIKDLRSLEYYERVNDYKDLNLAEFLGERKYSTKRVWNKNGKSTCDITIECLEILADPYEKCNEHLVEVGIGRFIHEQFCTRSGQTSGIGGRFPRHQVCLSHHPGMVGKREQYFTENSEASKNEQMILLEKIITE